MLHRHTRPERRAPAGSAARRLAMILAALLSLLVLTPAVAAADTYAIRYSQSPDRSNAADLQGATVAGKIYAFATPTTGASSVRFWLDNPTMAGTPRQTENTAPFDFAGGTASSANAFDTTTVADGAHTITASISLTAGGTVVTHAEFTVRNGAPAVAFDLARVVLRSTEGGTASQDVVVRTSDASSTTYTLTADRPWISATVGAAGPSAGVRVTAQTAGLEPGIYSGTLTASAAGYRSAVLRVHLSVGDQVHLSWASDPATTLTVVWHTASTTASSQVEYRALGSSAWTAVTGAKRTSGTAGTLHEVMLSGLTPASAYEYRHRRGDGTWSRTLTARTAPPAGRAADFDVVYLADTGLVGREDGLTTGTRQVVQEIARLNPLATLLGGDYAYFDTDKRFGSLENTIDAWFNQVQPIGERAPMMASYGNHEALLGEGYQPWANRFPTPTGFDSRRNYSFDVGDVHFVSIFAVAESTGLSSTQLQWIENDMASARARGQRWIVPFFHVSPFADGKNHPSNLAVRGQLGPLFERQGVKVALSSHDQAYERTYPLTDVPASNTPTTLATDCYTMDQGVTYVKVSPGGKLSNKNRSFSQFATTPAPGWTAVRDNTSHTFARVTVSAAGSLTVEAFGVKGDGSAPVVKDRFRYTTGACEGQADTAPPGTSIIGGPTGPTSGDAATFTLASTETGSTFECALDAAPFTACEAQVTLSGLPEGAHTLRARATDVAGNVDATPAERRWTVDLTPPAVTATSPVDGATGVDPSAPVTVSFLEDLARDSVTGTSVTLTRDGAASPVQATVAYDARTVRVTPSVPLDASSRYVATLAVDGVRDVAGNPSGASRSWAFTTGTASSLRVARLVLVNADTDRDIGVLTNGSTVSFAAVGTSRLNIRADTEPATVGSVVFGYDATARYRVENTAPYAIGGDSGGNYTAWTPAVGSHVVTATPYPVTNGAGAPGAAVTVSFTVTR